MSRDRVTPDQLRRLAGGARSKYGSRRAYVAEIDRHFASQREANDAVELLRRQQAGEVRGLRFQVPYDLVVNGLKVCRYVCDFLYVDCATGETIVADSKGFRTREYRIKAKLMLAIHGIRVLEL